ncbi:MAG: hypothetical protein SV239_05825 [Thermodesulfobacteriota bacterium]|jgi:hypothetical protein|nr:hypothetical protein [Thermodesulfobacteriota bacterium]
MEDDLFDPFQHRVERFRAIDMGFALGRLPGIVELDEKYLGGKPRFKKGVKHARGKTCE